jgi:hypothetical protein
MSKELKDLTGQKFFRLTVLELLPHEKGGSIRYRCRCDCGNESFPRGSYLSRGATKSCGCLTRERASELQSLPSGEGSMRALIREYKLGAKARKFDFTLTNDQFKEITQKPCFYCGVEPYRVYNHHRASEKYTYNGIDRVDNAGGYTIENSVSCCSICNIAKNNNTLGEFYLWLDRISEYRLRLKEQSIV